MNGVHTWQEALTKSLLLGNVGKDPEIRSTPSGTMVANLALATSDRQKDAQGNWQDHTEWHNLKAFNRTAEIVRDYVKKGSKLYIEGKITTNSWEDKETDQKRYRTEILVNELVAALRTRGRLRRQRGRLQPAGWLIEFGGQLRPAFPGDRRRLGRLRAADRNLRQRYSVLEHFFR